MENLIPEVIHYFVRLPLSRYVRYDRKEAGTL